MQLGIRTLRAILTLQRSKRMVELMEAVETLETSTRLSKSCCEAVADNLIDDGPGVSENENLFSWLSRW